MYDDPNRYEAEFEAFAVPAAAEPDDLAGAFPGLRLTHELHLASEPELDALIGVLCEVQAVGGRVRRLLATPCGDVLEHRLSLEGLAPARARTLCARIAELPGVRHARVEHRVASAA